MRNEIDDIVALEESFEVEHFSIEGVYVWPLIRMLLMDSWTQERLKAQVEDVPPRSHVCVKLSALSLIMRRYAKNAWSLICAMYRYKSLNTLAKFDVGVWAYDIDRVRIGNMDYSMFGDALRDLQDSGGASILCVDQYIENKMRHPPGPYFDMTLLTFFARIKAKLKKLPFRRQDIKLAGPSLENIVAWCRLRNLPCGGLTEQGIMTYYNYIKILKNYHVDIIKHGQLRLCVKVYWYGPDGMALAWAAKESNIPCYDIQHGLAGGSAHRAYCCWRKFPINGYLIMPDGFWCWSQRDKDAIDSWQQRQGPTVRSIVGGNVWNRVWIERKIAISDLSEMAGSLAVDCLGSGVKILFTMQTAKVPDIIQALIDCSPKHWIWWIRCHPSHIGEIHKIAKKFCGNDNVFVSVPSLSPLPLLLRDADIHISGWSAVALDALQYGLKSILFHPVAKGYFKNQIMNNDIYFSSDFEVIYNLIEKNDQRFSAKENLDAIPSLLELCAS